MASASWYSTLVRSATVPLLERLHCLPELVDLLLLEVLL